MVYNRRPDSRTAIDGGQGGRDATRLMQVHYDLGVQVVGIRAPVSETDDIQWHRRE